MIRHTGLLGLFVTLVGTFALASATSYAQADDVADFYKAKTIRVIIGTGVGGTYGVYGQLVARHFGRFVPGHPTVVMQSMQGAGGFTPSTGSAPRRRATAPSSPSATSTSCTRG